MINPRIITLMKLLPSVNYWFVEEGSKIRVMSDAIRQPEIVIDGKVSVKGEWIYKKGYSVIRKNEEGEEEALFSNQNAVDFVYVDEIKAVEQIGKTFVYNGEKFEKYTRKYAFSVLENKDKIKVIVNRKEIDVEKPLAYRINPTFLDLVYEDHSVVIDYQGGKTAESRNFFYLGKSSRGDIFQTLDGKIIVGREEELLGICSSEAHYLGEASVGIVIECDNKVKYYFRDGWSLVSGLSSLTASFANYNFVIITDFDSTVYDGEFKKLFSLKNVHAVFATRKYIYVVSMPKKLYIVEPLENYMPFEMKQDNYGIVITMDKAMYETFSLGQGLVKVSEADEGDRVSVAVEAGHLSAGAQSKVEVSNELYSYQVPVVLPPRSADIKLKDAVILVSDGRVKGKDSFYNSMLIAFLEYKLNSRLKSVVKVRVMDKEFFYTVSQPEGELILEIPLVKYDLREEQVAFSVIRNGYIETAKEYLSRARSVRRPSKVEKYEEIYNASRRLIEKSEDDYFEWVKMEEYPAPYNPAVIARAGDVVDVDGEKVKVEEGKHVVAVKRKNYYREYEVYGVPNPVKGVEAEITGNKLVVKLSLAYKVPVTAVYGTQTATSTNGVLSFDLDPFYKTIKVTANYSRELSWEMEYSVEELMDKALKKAVENVEKLRDYLSLHGIV